MKQRTISAEASHDDVGLITHWPRGCRPPVERRDTGTEDLVKLGLIGVTVALLVVLAIWMIM